MPEDISLDLNHISLEEVRSCGFDSVGQRLRRTIEDRNVPFYIHLDLDVLDETVFPATLYHLPNGMNWQELGKLLAPLVESPNLSAVSVGCYDPDMDSGERLAGDIANNIGSIFGARQRAA